MTIQLLPTAALLGVGLLATLPVAVSAQPTVHRETITATIYVNGGIGKEQATAMRRVAKEYPLRVTFTEHKDGEFLAGVPVVISDAGGHPVFALPDAGPMLYVALPDGKYQVRARFEGVTRTQHVTLAGKGGEDLYLHWNGRPEG